MPRQLALLICICVIFYLFWIDRKSNEGFSVASWVVFIWLFFSVSRSLYGWLSIITPGLPPVDDSLTEGNPLNRALYIILLIIGIIILIKRKFQWQSWLANNQWVWLFFIYATLSCFWSDDPYISFKRLVKALSTLIMALLVISEARPYIAIGVILKRLAFVLLPLSVLFIKYYTVWGRTYFMGHPAYAGVCIGKNQLGSLCLFIGIYFFWALLYRNTTENNTSKQLHISIYLIILPMIIWLFYMANSSTSTACMLIAICLFMAGKLPLFTKAPHKIFLFGIALAVLFGIAQYFFDVYATIIEMLGERTDLSSRVPMWGVLISMVENPFIGFGYQGFWTGERLVRAQSEFGPELFQAHNGYIEMYLNLGYIGIFFILCWLVSGLIKVKNYLIDDYTGGILRLCFILVAAFSNYTEASFYGPNTMWMLFFLGIMSVPEQIVLKKNTFRKYQNNKKESFQN